MTAHRPIRTGIEQIESFEAIVRRLRIVAAARQQPSSLVPFPDVEGETRDERPVTTWDFTR